MKQLIITSAIAMLVAAMANAQTETARTWSLEDCINYAIENNISLRQSRNNYLSGLEDTYQAKAAMLPTLAASTSHGITNRPFSESGASSVVGSNVYSTAGNTSYSGNYGLNAGMTLFNGGSLRIALKQQQVQNSMDSLSIQESTNSIVISIVQAYVQCLYAQENVQLCESTAEVSRQEMERAREMKDAGELSKVDLAQLESQHASDLYNVTTAKANLDNSLLTLKQLLELGVHDGISLASPESSEDKVLKLLPEKSEIYANALEAMPEIERAGLNVDAADLAIKQARTGYSPTLSASAGISTTNLSGASNSFASQLSGNMNESIGLSLSIPIFQGRRNKTAVNKAQIAADNTRLERQSVEKSLLKEVEGTYLDAVSAQSQYISAKEQVKYAEQSYAYTSEAFNVGKKNTVELITSKNSLLKAESSMLQAKYTAILNNTILDIYQGNYFYQNNE